MENIQEININNLQNYNNEVGNYANDLKNTFQGIHETTKIIIKIIADFLYKNLYTEKFLKQTIDLQNVYFSNKIVKDFISIVNENQSISEKTISEYISKSFEKLSLDGESNLEEFFFSKTDLLKFKKDINKKLSEIVSFLEENKESAKKSLKSESENKKNNDKDSEKKEPAKESTKKELEKTSIDIDSFFSKKIINRINLKIKQNTESNFNIINNFLKENVFNNFKNIIERKKISFSEDFDDIINYVIVDPFKYLKLSNIFRNVFNLSKSIINLKVGKLISNAGKKLYNAINLIFPIGLILDLMLLGKVLINGGIKGVKRILSFGYGLVSKPLKYTFDFVKNISNKIKDIGLKTFNFFKKINSKLDGFFSLKITMDIIKGFFKSHSGAYILGYFIGFIYGGVKLIIDYAKNLITKAKLWFEKNIYEPWIYPILNGMATYKDIILADFQTEETVKGLIKTDNIDEIVEITKNIDRHLRQNNILETIGNIIKFIEIDLSRGNLKEKFLDTAYSMTFGTLGGAIGGKIGMALGTLLPIPILGSILGAIVGSIGGELLGSLLGDTIRKIVKQNIKSDVKSPQSEFMRYSEENLNPIVPNATYRSIVPDYSESQSIQAITELSKEVSDTVFDIDQIQNEFKLQGINLGINFKELENAEEKEKYYSQLRLFKNLDNLSFKKIETEIKNTVFKWTDKLRKTGNGSILLDNVDDSDYKTSLTIDGNELSIDRRTMSFEDIDIPFLNINPFAYKIFRATKLYELMYKLSSREIPLLGENGFYENYMILSDPLKTLKKYKSETFNYNDDIINVAEFLYPMLSVWYDITKKDGVNYTAMANSIISDYKEPYTKWFYQSDKTYVGKTFENAIMISKDKIKYIPFFETPEDISFNNIIVNNMFSGGNSNPDNNSRLDSDIETKVNSFNDNGNDNDKMLFERFINTPNLKDAIKTQIINLAKTKGMTVKDLQKDEILYNSILEQAIRSILSQNKESPETLLMMNIPFLTNTISNSLEEVSKGSSLQDTSIDFFQKFQQQSDNDINILSGIFEKYRGQIEKNASLLENTIIPFLKYLKEKGLSNETVGNAFGVILNEKGDGIEEYHNPANDVTGQKASPNE